MPEELIGRLSKTLEPGQFLLEIFRRYALPVNEGILPSAFGGRLG
jgi:hypothetical protein